MFSKTFSELYTDIKAKVKTAITPDTLALALAYATPKSLSKGKYFAPFAPLIACVALIVLVLSSAWAIGALLHLLAALSLVYGILTRIFEIRVDIHA